MQAILFHFTASVLPQPSVRMYHSMIHGTWNREMGLKTPRLYSRFWRSFDGLLGQLRASQYKAHVFTLAFMKLASDKFDALIEAPAGGHISDVINPRGDN